jgi:transposase InsO family protein
MEPAVVMNIKKIRRLMNKYGLRCPIRKANPYRRMAKALRTSNVAPNLLNRKFRAHGPRRVLLTDITYLLYGNGGRSYLSTILDAYTKQLLAYVVSRSLEVDFVLETVNNLISDHGISLQTETLINSDQGCHYTSYKFIQLIRDSNLRQSMSRRANCWDNAPQESLFGHMKDEIDLSRCETHEQVAALIDDWVDYYNNDRYQWDLVRLSPNEYARYIETGIYTLNRESKKST